MSLNSIVKILSSANKVACNITQNFVNKGQSLVEDHIIKQKYVSREEFENLQQVVIKLENKLNSK